MSHIQSEKLGVQLHIHLMDIDKSAYNLTCQEGILTRIIGLAL